jgi:hypothetical protein
MRDSIRDGIIRLLSNGGADDAARFFGYVEPPLATPIRLVLR